MTERDRAADPPRRRAAPEEDPAETRQLTGPDATLLEPDGALRSVLRHNEQEDRTGREAAIGTETDRRKRAPKTMQGKAAKPPPPRLTVSTPTRRKVSSAALWTRFLGQRSAQS